jgi:hypothetical protein
MERREQHIKKTLRDHIDTQLFMSSCIAIELQANGNAGPSKITAVGTEITTHWALVTPWTGVTRLRSA